MSVVSDILKGAGSLIKNAVKPREGGSPVGNILRKVTNTKNPLDTAKAVGNAVGGLLGGSGSGLPKIKDILGGAAKGAVETVADSKAGQQVQKDVAMSYLKDNIYKIMAWVFGGIIFIISAVMFFKSQSKRR